jgi:hypothetical protein
MLDRNKVKRFTIRFYNFVAITVLNTFLLLITVELISTGPVKIIDRPATKKFIAGITGQPNDMVVYYQELSYFEKQEWSSRY